jgi:DNA-binding NarL/FixJ family response regulator
LADEQRLVREALAKLLEPSCDVVGTVADGRVLLAAAARLRPDIVVLDIAMTMLNGLTAARELRRVLPNVKVIFLMVSEDCDLVGEAFCAGASAYLLKTSAASELVRAIHDVFEGRSYVTPLITKELVDSFRHQPTKSNGVSSPRQREVLQLFAEGHTMKEIARILNITARTVAFHKYSMMKELGIKSSAELVHFAIKRNVVTYNPTTRAAYSRCQRSTHSLQLGHTRRSIRPKWTAAPPGGLSFSQQR